MKEKAADQAAEERYLARIEQEYEEKREKKKSVKEIALDYMVITLASAVYAAAVSLFIDPNNLAPGGVTGIAILLNRAVPLETGTLILLINIPIVLLGVWKFGIRFIVSTFYAIAMTSLQTFCLLWERPRTISCWRLLREAF